MFQIVGIGVLLSLLAFYFLIYNISIIDVDFMLLAAVDFLFF